MLIKLIFRIRTQKLTVLAQGELCDPTTFHHSQTKEQVSVFFAQLLRQVEMVLVIAEVEPHRVGGTRRVVNT